MTGCWTHTLTTSQWRGVEHTHTHTHTLPASDGGFKLLFMNKRKLKLELLITGPADCSSICANLRNFYGEKNIQPKRRLFKGSCVFFFKLWLLFTHPRCWELILKQPTQVWAQFLFKFTSLDSILTEAFVPFRFLPLHFQFLSFVFHTAVKEEK